MIATAPISIECGSIRKALSRQLDSNFSNNVAIFSSAKAFRLAIDAALTVLRVDQIIMSKPAGGGKMKDARMGQV